MRLFLAIDFPEKVKVSLSNKINIVKQDVPNLKWINKLNFHITLKFLGEIDFSIQRKIESALNVAFQSVNDFYLCTSITGFFPNAKKPRVFYLSLDPSDGLNECYSIIENSLPVLGIEKEKRKFNPHITLARIKNIFPNYQEQQLLQAVIFQKLKINVQQITLMQSNLSSSGVRYTPVQRFSLRIK